MKYFFILFCFVLNSLASDAQVSKHRVVWDLSSADTTVQGSVFRQINNARTEIPDLDIEVVFHGQAVFAVMKDSTQFASRIKIAKEKGVTLAVCNNSLRRLKIDPSQVSPLATVVPSAVAELIKKQTDGWSYLKASH
ncbi:MAG: DsrE family protein [Bacteroidota bacterium]|jgi:intracellular sulfur oxidation DsrE/DsrF family protein